MPQKNKIGITVEQCKVGAPVNYYSYPGAEPFPTKLTSEPWQLGHGQWVVLVEGKTVGMALTHLELIEAPEPVAQQ